MNRSRSLPRRIPRGLCGAALFAALTAWTLWGNRSAFGGTGGGPDACGLSGGNVTDTTSTTHHTTYTRKDLPDVQAFETTVLAFIHSRAPLPSRDAPAFDATFDQSFATSVVQDAVAAARNTLIGSGARLLGFEADVSTCHVTGPAVVASSTSSHTDFLGNQVNHITTTVTSTTTFGPATILIGDDQSQSFFVAAGTTNCNTNTHFETYMDQVYQTTNTLSQTFQLDGFLCLSHVAVALSTPMLVLTALLALSLGVWRLRSRRAGG